MNGIVRTKILSGVLAVFPLTIAAQAPPPAPGKAPASPATSRTRMTAPEAPAPPASSDTWDKPVVTPVPPRAAMDIGDVPDLPDSPEMPPLPPTPALAPAAPMAPLLSMPAMAPMPPMPSMPALTMTQDMMPESPEPMLLAMGFDQDPDSTRDQMRLQAEKAREASRAASRKHSSDDSDYRRGTDALDRHDYDRAVDAFNRVVENRGERSDGALYWRAYAQNKLGQRDAALATLAELQKTYAQSRWIEDARALDVEVRQASGQALSPENASDEDLKLLALQSLINTDPERSIPLLEKLLKGSGSPRLKERALFVLAQSRSPKAHDLLAQIAKGTTNPDVQLKAIEYLGINSSTENQQLLADVYKGTSDVHVKRAILRSFMIAHNREALLQAARSESNQELRLEALRQLGVMGGAAELYSTESSYEGKRAILQGLMQSGDGQKLTDIAKNEKDPKLRVEAIHLMGVMGRSKTGDTLVVMYRQESDAGVKREIINGLFIQQNAPALVDIARKETDPAMKKEVVSRLSIMHSKEATDYLMEILSK